MARLIAWREWLVLAAGLLACVLLPTAPAQADPGPLHHRHHLTFTSFPSDGMALLFRRILTEAYGRIHYDVDVVGVPGERALVMSNQGEVDGEAARVPVIEASCPNLIRVPTPLYVNRVVVFSRVGDIDLSDGWEALYPYRVGVVRGYKFVDKMTASMNRVLATDYENLFTMLETGRLDVAVTEYFEALPMLKEMQPHNFRLLLPPLAYKPMYHYLHKQHADLVPGIDRALRDMRREGRMQEIQREIEQDRGRPRCLGQSVVPFEPPGDQTP
jgi:polar amino acid transport system substrate-binding protein